MQVAEGIARKEVEFGASNNREQEGTRRGNKIRGIENAGYKKMSSPSGLFADQVIDRQQMPVSYPHRPVRATGANSLSSGCHLSSQPRIRIRRRRRREIQNNSS